MSRCVENLENSVPMFQYYVTEYRLKPSWIRKESGLVIVRIDYLFHPRGRDVVFLSCVPEN